jgi:methylated-DNA-[protein]-cysteine S-methyltransferase
MWIELSRLESPVGVLQLAMTEEGLSNLEFDQSEATIRSRLEQRYPQAQIRGGRQESEVVARLRAYFAGELGALDAIAVSPLGTPFQKSVWRALRKIPVGRTASYRQIAAAIGKPSAVRAVGAANGQNPVAVVVPCHRVIASDGTLCGYGGGLWRKEWLLCHERALPLQLETY